MQTWISLLRGINVGGKNRLPMSELRDLLVEIGVSNPRTYIQSGNCVYEAAGVTATQHSTRIAQAIESQFGFKPGVVTLSASQLQQAVSNCPYAAAVTEPTLVHLFFLAKTPTGQGVESMESLRAASESTSLSGKVLYLHAPEGVARSKLMAGAERKLGVIATARNYKTAAKLVDLSQ